jgi:hypothetical protein
MSRLTRIQDLGWHYVIEGQHFPSVAAIHKRCVAMGFDGGTSTIGARLKAGVTTWAGLCAPKSSKMDSANAGRARRQQQEREEMARLCAELDARKAVRR